VDKTTTIDTRLPFDWDEVWYLSRYPDIAEAVAQGRLLDPFFHFLQTGFREGRFPSAAAEQRAHQTLDDHGVGSRDRVQLGPFSVPLDWPVKGEIGKTFTLRLVNGFFRKYLSGPAILDIGFRGASADAVPILPHAIGIDVDYPGYDGVRLPFADESVDTVFASHVLEHVPDAPAIVREWFRVIRVGGYIVCIVPHQFLYERKRELPSKWSGEHLRFYTPGSLLCEFETSLRPNTYRVRHLSDNDLRYDYDLNADLHPFGCYEIEFVVQKITPPQWDLS
jgi:SAM-dependent methyltransferase